MPVQHADGEDHRQRAYVSAVSAIRHTATKRNCHGEPEPSRQWPLGPPTTGRQATFNVPHVSHDVSH